MTQEQKAKAYDEALKRAKFFHWNCPSEPERKKLEKMFPVLRESKDDRIRKSLIKFLTDIKEISESGRTTWAVRKEDAEMCKSFIAWLEKQKENPKSTDSIPSDCTADAKCEDRWHKVVDSLPDNPREVLCKDEAGNYFIGRYYVGEGWEISNYDDEDKPHHLNPPVSKWIDFPSERQKEQKPQTDDEKEYIRTIKSIISDFIRDKKPENLAYYQRIYDWLDERHVPFSCGRENGKPADPVFSKQEYESHPIISKDTTAVKPAGATINSEPIPTENHSVDIPLAEWSEEDGKTINDACCWIAEYAGYLMDKNYGKASMLMGLTDKLKSLRPQSQGIYQQVVKGIRDMCDRYEQNGMFTDERARDFLGNVRVKCKDAIECAPILDEPSWKPSEEQMEALDKARRFIPYNCDVLESLYIQLKNL